MILLRRLLLLAALLLAASANVAQANTAFVEPPPLILSGRDVEPVVRVGAMARPDSFPLRLLWDAETIFQRGQADEAVQRFLDLAYNAPDGERKGFVWARIGELLLAKGELNEALSAIDKAIPLSRGRYQALAVMELKLRVTQKLGWRAESRQLAGYLVDQGFVGVDGWRLLADSARSSAEEGRLVEALPVFRRALAEAPPEEAGRLRAERDRLVDQVTDLAALKEAADAEGEDAETRGRFLLALGRLAGKRGFTGMGIWALERVASVGGPSARDASDLLFRLEKIAASRPKIVGLLPLSGKYADIGFSVLSGAEVALAGLRRKDADAPLPVLRWVDTGGSPEKAKKEYLAAASDRLVTAVVGPLTGDEGKAVAGAMSPKSPPVFYLGQKAVPEKSFLFGFGLSPRDEAKAIVDQIKRGGGSDLLLLHPENGYGKGFAEAVVAAATASGVKIRKTESYPSATNDFTDIIRRAAGNVAFQKDAKAKEKGSRVKMSMGAVVVADRWDRVFQVATQLRYYNVYLPLFGFSGWYDPALPRKAGDAVAGAVFSVDYAEEMPGLAGETFRKDFRETAGRVPSRFEAAGFDAATAVSLAFLSDQSRDKWFRGTGAEALRERLPRMRSYQGLTGTFTFDSSGAMRRKTTLLKIEFGNFVPMVDSPQ